jgi:hypothetical protein
MADIDPLRYWAEKQKQARIEIAEQEERDALEYDLTIQNMQKDLRIKDLKIAKLKAELEVLEKQKDDMK